MEGMGNTNTGIVSMIRKRQHRITKKTRFLGKTLRNQSIQPNIAGLFVSYLYHLAIPTTTPSFYFFLRIAEYK
jgi:hypothetical protein